MFATEESQFAKVRAVGNVNNSTSETGSNVGAKQVTHQLWSVAMSQATYKSYAASCPDQLPANSSEASPTVLFWYNNPHTTPLTNGQDVVVHFPFEKKDTARNTDEQFRKTPHLGVLVECHQKRSVATSIPQYSQQVLRKALAIEVGRGSAVTSKKKKATITRLSRRGAQAEAETSSFASNTNTMRAGDSPSSSYSDVSMRANSENSSVLSARLSPTSGTSTPTRHLNVLRKDGSTMWCSMSEAEFVSEGDCVVCVFGNATELCMVAGETHSDCHAEGSVLRRAAKADLLMAAQNKQMEATLKRLADANDDDDSAVKIVGAEVSLDQAVLNVIFTEESTYTRNLDALRARVHAMLAPSFASTVTINCRRVCLCARHCPHGTSCRLGMYCAGKCHCGRGYDTTPFDAKFAKYVSGQI